MSEDILRKTAGAYIPEGVFMQKIAEETVNVTVVLSKQDRERLERIAKRQRKGKESKLSDGARNMLVFGIDVYEDFERTGLVRVVEVFQAARRKFEEEGGEFGPPILDTIK